MVMWRCRGRPSHVGLDKHCCWVSWQASHTARICPVLHRPPMPFSHCSVCIICLKVTRNVRKPGRMTWCLYLSGPAVTALEGASRVTSIRGHKGVSSAGMKGPERWTMAPLRSKVTSPRCFQLVIKGHGNRGHCFLINEQGGLPQGSRKPFYHLNAWLSYLPLILPGAVQG